jgi:hypothetical protein
MAQLANEQHEYMLWTGDQAMANLVGCSRRTIERCKAEMVEADYLEDLHERHENGNLLYRFLMPGEDQCDISSTSEGATNATSARTNATSATSAPTYKEKELKGSRKRSPETPFPEGKFTITAAMKVWLTENDLDYLDVRFETLQFKDHALANERKCRDWVAAWRTWMRKAGKFTPKQAEPGDTEEDYNNPTWPDPTDAFR